MLNSSTIPTLTYVKLAGHISVGHYQTMKTMIVEDQICNNTILDNQKIHGTSWMIDLRWLTADKYFLKPL
jgi:hypothetical protein